MDRNKNRGFTLIEIIITIAIMAIVTVGSVSIYSWIKSNRLKSLSENTNNVISDLRTETMSKSGRYKLQISYDSNKQYVAKIYIVSGTDGAGNPIWSVYDTQNLGTRGDISVDAGGTVNSLKSGWVIELEYNKADGSFKTATCSKGTTSYSGITDLDIEYGGNTRTVKLITLTGKHYIE